MDWLFVVYIAAAAVVGLAIGVILHKAVVTKRLGDADGRGASSWRPERKPRPRRRKLFFRARMTSSIRRGNRKTNSEKENANSRPGNISWKMSAAALRKK